MRGLAHCKCISFGLEFLAILLSLSLPAPGYAIGGTEMAPPKRNRPRGSLVPAVAVPSRDTKTSEGTGEGLLAGPSTEMATASDNK